MSCVGAATAGDALGAPSRGEISGGCKRRCTDATAPQVTVQAPTSGTTVSGEVLVTGAAADNVGVVSVSVRLDDGPWVPASGTSTWSARIDTRGSANGSHTIGARASDAAANSSTITVTTTVANPTTDTTAPSLAITSPATGATVSGQVTVTGTTSDAGGLAGVAVAVDDGPWQPATGTSTWSHPVDAASLAAGGHTIAARAADSSGNVTTTSVTVTVPGPSDPGDVIVTDPAATHGLEMLGRTRLPTWGPVTGVLASESFTQRKIAWFRDATSGATSAVTLPSDSAQGWYSAGSVMTSPSDLWVLGGTGPLVLRHYLLSGGALPSSAQLVESRTLGDTDSRAGDLLGLASGAVVAAWHQQGSGGLPHGQFVGYQLPGQAWQQLPRLAFMPTRASNQVLGQHPADGSVWLFSDPDAWGNIGAARLVAAGAGLEVAWTDASFISDEEFGEFGADQENAYLAVAADPSTATLALAYQSADRRYFGSGPLLAGSRVAVARIAADGTMQFIAAPVWAERVSAVGLIVGPGETVVSYRPIDEATLTFDDVATIRHREGEWQPAVTLGTLGSGSWTVGYGTARPAFAAQFEDGLIHLRTV